MPGKMKQRKLRKISDHVYWMPPAAPDRPSLCAVVGSEKVVMLDAGASTVHARQFLDQLDSIGISRPEEILLTHWHWDHVFGAAEVGAKVIAQKLTAEKLAELSTRDWSDAGLEQQVATGLETVKGAENIRAELPSPREISVAQADVVFDETMELSLGSVTCRIEHVGGDHAEDSSVILVLPERVLFIGDCLGSAFYAPKPYYTVQQLIPLLDRIQAIDAAYYVEGHSSKVFTRAEFDEEIDQMREAVEIVEESGADEKKAFALVKAKTGEAPDENWVYYISALIAGLDK